MFGIVGYEHFILSAILLNLVPGSDTIYILSRAAVGGRRCGVVSALGISTGILIHTVLAALGLSVILAQSALAFNLVKGAGALYLIVLGVRTILSRQALLSGPQEGEGGAVPRRRVAAGRADQRSQSQGGPVFPGAAAPVRHAGPRLRPAALFPAGTDLLRHQHRLEPDSCLSGLLFQPSAPQQPRRFQSGQQGGGLHLHSAGAERAARAGRGLRRDFAPKGQIFIYISYFILYNIPTV